jgi:hypothetical protein
MTEYGTSIAPEIKAYINIRFLFGMNPVNIHRAVYDIYGNGQM